ncbi:hypothetical protein NHX12_004556 [Muraenolepis orangiensis]|uniref:Uncharacterized protein n=1 Tax=Muraenolepis orangiensis TaxID=630683 RepID=A0A9Q0DVH5_9TELE|nr:hypothetical protein NHX12_004556 [Muraenolepis orangiensis]
MRAPVAAGHGVERERERVRRRVEQRVNTAHDARTPPPLTGSNGGCRTPCGVRAGPRSLVLGPWSPGRGVKVIR